MDAKNFYPVYIAGKPVAKAPIGHAVYYSKFELSTHALFKYLQAADGSWICLSADGVSKMSGTSASWIEGQVKSGGLVAEITKPDPYLNSYVTVNEPLAYSLKKSCAPFDATMMSIIEEEINKPAQILVGHKYFNVGIYSKPRGKAYIRIYPSGHLSYVSSAGSSKPLTSTAFISLYDGGMSVFSPDPAAPAAAPKKEPAASVVDPVSLFQFDKDGYAKPCSFNIELDGSSVELKEQIQKISKEFGDGKVVGVCVSSLHKYQRHNWLKYWQAGDMQSVYSVEVDAKGASYVTKSHPGYYKNKKTNKINWQAAVAGEVPAGVDVPGKWSSLSQMCSEAEINNYLISAKMKYPDYLSTSSRRLWVKSHRKGDKTAVDVLSMRARDRAVAGHSPLTSIPVWSDDYPIFKSYTNYVETDYSVSYWSSLELDEYILDFDLKKASTLSSKRKTVAAHIQKIRDAEDAEARNLTFSLSPDPLRVCSTHPVFALNDQYGRKWVFKPAPGGLKFRSEIEHEANCLARLWGYKSTETKLIEFDGQFGVAQRFVENTGDLSGLSPSSISLLTDKQLRDVALEHLLDWALDNDDSKGDNLLQTTSGGIVGVDKGRAWCYFGAWDGLSGTTSSNSNASLVSTVLFDSIAKGHISKDRADKLFSAVIERAFRIESFPDKELTQCLERAFAHRNKWSAPSYQASIPNAPHDKSSAIEAITTRKNRLAKDMTTLWRSVYKRAGWSLPKPSVSSVLENTQGHRLHTSFSKELLEDVAKTKSYGTSVFFAGPAFEDMHILLWRERNDANSFVLRGECKIRAPFLDMVESWFRSKVKSSSSDSFEKFQGESAAYNHIVDAAKTISFHVSDGEYNQGKIQEFNGTKKWLTKERTRLRKLVKTGAATYDEKVNLEMVELYLSYVKSVEKHKEEKTKSKRDEYPRYKYVPEAVPCEPSTVTVSLTKAHRKGSDDGADAKFDAFGDLMATGPDLKEHAGGDMYVAQLKTGETIDFQGNKTGTSLTAVGKFRFSVPWNDKALGSLGHVKEMLAEAGVVLESPSLVDFELFYWRHLKGVIHDRADFQSKFSYVKLNNKGMSSEKEVEEWRSIFSKLAGDDRMAMFLYSREYLPVFRHLDISDPERATGKPYWFRCDVTADWWKLKQFPVIYYKSTEAGERVVKTGGAFSTESRLRTLGIRKTGMSSDSDMTKGSGDFLFSRLNMEHNGEATLYLNPRVLTRTSTYGFDEDYFGIISSRGSCSYFDFDSATAYAGCRNETMIKDSVSLLDDIEVMSFTSDKCRKKAIAHLKAEGITEIRGVPVEKRLVSSERSEIRPALKLAKAMLFLSA